MNSIFDLTQPRPEVLRGELSEEMFAARLKDVMDGTADPVYGDAADFFSNTYPTDGLRTLLREVLGRLTGETPTNNPVIRLETSFGGGKTHNLIALYHVASGRAERSSLQGFVQDALQLPAAGTVDIAGVVGSDLDPMTGIYHPADGVTTYTLWGELAYQLGGRAGYALAQQSDTERTAPGTGLFERLIGTRPTLIMIDEIARHLRAAVAVPSPSGKSNLSEQTVAFLMSLMEYVASQRKVVLVLTMAGEEDAFSKETADLREALRVSARQERVLTPSGENEISSIVVHRLFAHVDRAAAKEVIDRYGAYYRELEKQDAAIHDRALRADYIKEFELAYPFHPELIRVLNLKVATIPNFQRTRGALRLLAAVVRRIWDQQPADTWLIHTYGVDLGYEPIVEELSSRLDRAKFKQVSEADIVSFQPGIPAHAAHADELLVAGGRPAYARRLGTTIFLHSLTQGIASGVELPELLLATLTPDASSGDDPVIVGRALEGLYDQAWFLEYDGFRYRFKTEPSLNKIVDDETSLVTTTRAKQEIDDRLRTIWRAGYLKPIFFPVTPADVEDDAGKPKLAIVHYDALQIDAAASEPPEMIRRIAEVAGLTESFRNYQNNLLFLVADTDQVSQMVAATRRYLAIERITGSTERMRSFNDEQQKKLREMKQDTELQVRIAITRAYRYLFYPSADAPKSHAFLQRETVPPQAQGDTNIDQTNVLVRILHALNKVHTADDNPLSAKYLKARAWDRQQSEMSTEDLRRAFARKVALPILLDVTQMRKTIENGIKTGEWLYYDTRDEWAYDADSPPTAWEISEQTRLFLPEEAARRNLRIKGKWKSPETTGSAVAPPVDDEPPEDALIDVIGVGRPAIIEGHGPVSQAFQQVRDSCAEHGAAAVRRLTLSFNGMGRNTAEALAAVGLAIPQLGKAQFAIRLKMLVQFDPPPGESLAVEFQGGWDRYKRIKQVSDAFAREDAHSLNIEFSLKVDFERDVPLDDPQFVATQDVLMQLLPGAVTLTAVPVYSA
jgi:hypothetical protein